MRKKTYGSFGCSIIEHSSSLSLSLACMNLGAKKDGMVLNNNKKKDKRIKTYAVFRGSVSASLSLE